MATIALPRPAAAPVLRPWEPLKRWRRKVAAQLMQYRVRSRDFSIISNDCWGGMAYEELAMAYRSPFVGLFIVPADYIRLLADLRPLLESELRFHAASKDPVINSWREEIRRDYPIGILGDDIEVHFLHYTDRLAAETKWRRRCGRINWDKLRLKMCWHDHPNIDEHLRAFDELPFESKLILAPHAIPGCKHSVQLRDYSTDGTQQYYRTHREIDVARFLDRGGPPRATAWTPLDSVLYWHY